MGKIPIQRAGAVPFVQVPSTEIPEDFLRRCDQGELGSVVLVFINARNTAEMDMKKKELIQFAKRIKKKYAVVQPQ